MKFEISWETITSILVAIVIWISFTSFASCHRVDREYEIEVKKLEIRPNR